MSIQFQEWPKIARLNRDIIITEKIDGTNGAVIIEEFPFGYHVDTVVADGILVFGPDDEGGTPAYEYVVGAQSRKRLITPENDNFGFAKWVYSNARALANVLGPGRHFGEWWGHGIQRGYGCEEGDRTFSLFNVKRWDDKYDPETWPHGLSIVPVMYWGPYDQQAIELALEDLRNEGSYAIFGFKQPEGIVVYHTAANDMFKVTLENDEAPKSLKASGLQEQAPKSAYAQAA